jgi:hypothetical protein
VRHLIVSILGADSIRHRAPSAVEIPAFELSGSMLQLTWAGATRLYQVFGLRLAPTFNLARILGRFGFLWHRLRIKSFVDQWDTVIVGSAKVLGKRSISFLASNFKS